jgi:hypothetical protein
MMGQIRDHKIDQAETEEEKAEIETSWNERMKEAEVELKEGDAKQAAIDLQREILNEYIEANRKELSKVYGNVVPAMLKAVSRIKTADSLKTAMRYMENVMTKQADREEAVLWSNRYEALNKALKPETYVQKGSKVKQAKPNVKKPLLDKLEKFRNNLFNKSRDEALNRVVQIYEELNSGEISDEEAGKLFDELEELKTHGIWDMGSGDLKLALDYIKAEIAGERSKAKKQHEAERMAYNEMISYFSDYIRGKKVKLTPRQRGRKKKFGVKRTIIDFVNKNANFFSVLDRLSVNEYAANKDVDLYKSVLYQKFADMVHEADNEYHDGVRRITQKSQDKFAEIFTKDENGKELTFGIFGKKQHLLKMTHNLKNEEEEIYYDPFGFASGTITKADEGWVVVDEEGNQTEPRKERNDAIKDFNEMRGKAKTSIPYTQDEMINAALIMQQEGQWERLAAIPEGQSMGGLIRMDMREGSETYGQLVKTDLANAIEQQLDPRAKKWGEYMQSILNNELYDRYNEQYKKHFVFDMPRDEGGTYFPIFAETTKGETTPVEDLLAEQSAYENISMNNRHLMRRVKNKTPIRDMGATNVFYSYVEKMEWFRARGDTVKELRGFFKNPEIRGAIEDQAGTVYLEIIDQFLDRYSGKRQTGVQHWLDKIRAKLTRATLAIKPVIAIKQLMSYPAFAAFIPAHQLPIGTLAMFTENGGFLKNWKMLSDSSFMLNRYGLQFERDLANAVQRDYKTNRPRFDYFMDHMMFNIKWGDRMPIITGGYAVYRHNLKQYKKGGKSQEEAHRLAIKDFEQAVRYTQQASDIADLGFWQTESSMSKLFTMYMTAPLSYQRMVSQGVRMISHGLRKTPGQGRNWTAVRKGIKASFIGHIILPTLFQFAANGFELDDEEDKRDLMWAAILGNINNYFMIGDMMSTLIDSWRGRPWEYQATPVASIITDTKDVVVEMRSIVDDMLEGKGISMGDIAEFLEIASQPLAYGLGWPLPGISNVERGIRDAIEEEQAAWHKKVKWAAGYSKRGLDKAEFDTDKKGKSKYR